MVVWVLGCWVVVGALWWSSDKASRAGSVPLFTKTAERWVTARGRSAKPKVRVPVQRLGSRGAKEIRQEVRRYQGRRDRGRRARHAGSSRKQTTKLAATNRRLAAALPGDAEEKTDQRPPRPEQRAVLSLLRLLAHGSNIGGVLGRLLAVWARMPSASHWPAAPACLPRGVPADGLPRVTAPALRAQPRLLSAGSLTALHPCQAAPRHTKDRQVSAKPWHLLQESWRSGLPPGNPRLSRPLPSPRS